MFFGPPKQGSPPSPLSTTEARSAAASKRSEFATVSGSPIGVLRVGHRRVEPLHHGPRRELDDVMVGAAVRRDGRSEVELVRDPAPEREREGRDGAAVQPARQRRDDARIDPARQRRRDGARGRQAPADRLFQPRA